MADWWLVLIALLALALSSWCYFKRTRTKRQIAKWQRSLNLGVHALAFQQLYQHINGFLLSHMARKEQNALEYTYGEIKFHPFIALLSLAKPDTNTIFYDLGSGTGKAVIACAMVYPVQQSVGIELFSDLHACACSQQQKLSDNLGYAQQAAKIEFIQDDFLTADLSAATLIFINSTALFGPSWDNLCQRLAALPKLQTVITTSKPLKAKEFMLTTRTHVEMSWGIVSAFIHLKNK